MDIFLIILGISLIITNTYGLKKDKLKEDKKGSLGNDGNGFKNKLENKNKDLSDYDVKLAMFQNKIAKEMTLIRDDLDDLKKTVKDEILSQKNNEDITCNLKIDTVQESTNINNKIRNGNITKVNNLIKRDYNIDEIADKLNISKGEVLLIKNLYLK